MKFEALSVGSGARVFIAEGDLLFKSSSRSTWLLPAAERAK